MEFCRTAMLCNKIMNMNITYISSEDGLKIGSLRFIKGSQSNTHVVFSIVLTIQQQLVRFCDFSKISGG